MKALGVIPARYGSTRFPGKPLVSLSGKPLIGWVIERAKSAKNLDGVVVATDDQRIADVARKFGAEVEMTDSDLPSGSDRVWAAVKNRECEIVLNIQGDEPLITGEALDQLVDALRKEPTLEMATLGRELNEESLHSPNTAKIVLNQRNEALYFSRLPIPHSRESAKTTQYVSLKHVGIYCYRRSFLERFCLQKPIPLELAEGLEQLRALYLGAKIKVIPTSIDSWGVDTPEDVVKVEAKLRGKM